MGFFTNLKEFWYNLKDYLIFLKGYFRHRFYQGFLHFEDVKSVLVDGLVAKRGKYIRPFLHTSMSGLFLIGLMLAPVIKSVLSQDDLGQTFSIAQVLGSTSLEDSTTTQVSVKPRDSVVSYTVKQGETISSIAIKFGVSEDTILWQNDLEDDDIIKPGQKLEIPPVTGVVHKVKRGETINSIAKKYSVEAQNLVNWPFNSFANDETFELTAGQLVVVPEGVMPEEQAAPEYIAQKRQTISAGNVSATGSFVWPASGYISQYSTWYHTAIDIANPASPDILAADSGTVVTVLRQKFAYGHHVLIDHGNGFVTLYAHMTDIYVTQGQTIAKGQAVGRMGCTGRCTGTHLHFEIRKNGVLQNPMGYLQ